MHEADMPHSQPCHIKINQSVLTPLLPNGEGNFMLALERWKALMAFPFLQELVGLSPKAEEKQSVYL